MKRRLTAMLAALLVLGCLAPALAADAGEPEATLFDQFGPWGKWTQEQTDAAEGWTEDQWMEYWDDYEFWAWAPMARFYEDSDNWSSAYYGSQYDWDSYLREQKVTMGMPYPDGVNVSLNGKYLGFGGVAPLAVEGRTMVPVRAFLEALGAKVTYDNSGSISAVLENGDSLGMRLGSSALEWVHGDKIDTLDMGAAPHVEGGHTYIPARAAAQALGLDVYWDDTYETVYLTDWQALTDELDSHFTCMNEILSAAVAGQDPAKTYATTGSFALKGTLYGEKEHDTATLGMNVSGLAREDSFSADMTLKLDLGGLRDTVFSVLDEEGMAVVDALDGSKYSVIYSGEEGACYAKGSELALLSGDALPDDTWIGAHLPALLQSFTDPAQVPTLGEVLVSMNRDGYYYRQSPWERTMNTARPFRLALDDENFTKKTTGQTDTYTMKLDLLTLAKRAAQLGMLEDFSVTDYLTGRKSVPEVNLKLTATVQAGKLTRIGSTGSVKLDGVFPLEATFDVAGTPTEMKATYAFKGAYVGKVEMTASSQSSETTRAVPSAPPEGAEIVWMD